jgi:hypothetical protein
MESVDAGEPEQHVDVFGCALVSPIWVGEVGRDVERVRDLEWPDGGVGRAGGSQDRGAVVNDDRASPSRTNRLGRTRLVAA